MRRSGGGRLAALLGSPEIERLIEELEATRWTGRPGYPIRAMVGLALAKCLYGLPAWTTTVALVAGHRKLQRVLGCEADPPSHWSAYRFARKLRENGESVRRCIEAVVEALKAKLPSGASDLVRGLERVRMHLDLTTLTRLACALGRVRAATGTDSLAGRTARCGWGDRESIRFRPEGRRDRSGGPLRA
jgi:transposase-like protein DUF772